MATPNKRATAAQRFWAKVERGEGCWVWRGAVAKSGRGAFWVEGRQVPAHRFAYELAHGVLPAVIKVGHRCRRPLCVRTGPGAGDDDHLFAASQEEVDRWMRRALEEQT